MVEDEVRQVVAAWVSKPRLSPLSGGMNSRACCVEDGLGDRYVVKVMHASSRSGLEVALLLEARGLTTGAPVASTTVGAELVALLRYVSGKPLRRSHADVIGETLGRAHALLRGAPAPAGLGSWPWRWLDLAVVHEPDLRRSAQAAADEAAAVGTALTHGILHGDPAPEAFLAGGGDVALIDWGSAIHGPLLYDLASACMYAGNGVVDGYLRTAPLPAEDLMHLDRFRAFRWAVQAWYFSRRIAEGDRTGIDDDEENERGLDDARAALLG
jgi:Ser/Thr protein kinase RdoA (MazF antagonist)